MNEDLVVIGVPYKPFLSVVKDGCTMKNVHFLIIDNKKGLIWKILFRFFFFCKMYALALKCKISEENQKKFYSLKQNPSTRFLFWGQFYLPWWITMAACLEKNKKACFCWGPMGNAKNLKERERHIQLANKKKISFFTINQSDANKYGMIYTTQCYRFYNNIIGGPIKSDFYFLGYKKGREKILLQLQEKIEQQGFSTNFILRDHNQNETDFTENVILAKQSRCIVDIVANHSIYKQDGMTLRPLEALFLKKKLITNYKKIVDCDFYHPNNVFLITDDLDVEKLTEFMNLPFHPIDENIVKQYEVNYWVQKYFMGKK